MNRRTFLGVLAAIVAVPKAIFASKPPESTRAIVWTGHLRSDSARVTFADEILHGGRHLIYFDLPSYELHSVWRAPNGREYALMCRTHKNVPQSRIYEVVRRMSASADYTAHQVLGLETELDAYIEQRGPRPSWPDCSVFNEKDFPSRSVGLRLPRLRNST